MSPKAPKKTFSDLKAAAQKGLANIDVDALKDKAAGATSIMVEKAGELKDAAVDVKDDIAAKLTELDRISTGNGRHGINGGGVGEGRRVELNRPSRISLNLNNG